jgi:hypothetical protein
MIFCFKEIWRQGINPELLRRGNKLIELRVPKTKTNGCLIFRDSFNLFGQSLDAVISAFGLDNEHQKYFFPMLLNQPDNYDTKIIDMPSKDQYLYGGFAKDKAKRFNKWYAEKLEYHRRTGEPAFFLNEEISKYCLEDTAALAAALVKFQTEFFKMSRKKPLEDPMEVTGISDLQPHGGIDVLKEGITIASICMKHFRLNYLRPGVLPIVSERGYDLSERQSYLAMKFMKWYEKKHGVSIRNAYSENGELRIGNYKVDGWIEEQGKVLEINGCVYHGCPVHFPEDQMKLPNGRTAGKQRELDRIRLDFIKRHVRSVEVYWECDIWAMVDEDPEMKHEFNSYLDTGPLILRDGFFGGRVQSRKLFHSIEQNPSDTIFFLDFNSLYPHVCFSASYPVGIPQLMILNQEVSWQQPEHNPYKTAIMKVFLVPPRPSAPTHMKVPVMPLRLNDRTVFIWCRSCCEKYPEGAVIDYDQAVCEHDDFQRGWVSTCCSPELDLSLAEGYTVTKVYRVLNYERSDDTIFKQYIRQFQVVKLESSELPSEIRNNEEALKKFIAECKERFGIELDINKLVANKALSKIGKLMCNNAWGKFAQSCSYHQTEIIDDPSLLHARLEDKRIDVVSLDQLSADQIIVTSVPRHEYVESGAHNNIVVSMWTTAMARIKLYQAMKEILNVPQATLLYCDTVSPMEINR